MKSQAEQLGLRLVKASARVDLLVVDQIRPLAKD